MMTAKRSFRHLHFLRNQEKKEAGVPNLSLADFIAPKGSGKVDYIGLFAVTAGIGIEKWVKHYEDELDDYSSYHAEDPCRQVCRGLCRATA